MGSALGISVVAYECLEYCSIKNVVSSLARMGNDPLSNVSSWSTTLKASLPILAKNPAFFVAALRSQGGSKKSR